MFRKKSSIGYNTTASGTNYTIPTVDSTNNSGLSNHRYSGLAKLGLAALFAGVSLVSIVGCGGGSGTKPVVAVECKPCASGEVQRYQLRLNHEFNSLTSSPFLQVPAKKQIVFKSDDTRNFVYEDDRTRLKLHRSDIIADNREEVRGTLARIILPQTLVSWYDAGLARVARNPENYRYGIDEEGLLKIYDDVRKTNGIRRISSDWKGGVFFHVIERDYGWTPGNDKVPERLHDKIIRGGFVTDDMIFDLYQQQLNIDPIEFGQLKETMAHLKSQGIDP